MRTCTNCKIEKSLEQFYKKQHKCIPCHKEHASLRVYRIRQEVYDFKESKGCADCGRKFPYYVLQFEHRGNKLFQISGIIGHISRERLWKEIAKCDVVCANCHAIRTWGSK